MSGITGILIFLIPITAIVTSHFQKMASIKRDAIAGEIELERLKHENYLLETEKMRLELSQMKIENPLEKNL